jgi:hypothetical protein
MHALRVLRLSHDSKASGSQCSGVEAQHGNCGCAHPSYSLYVEPCLIFETDMRVGEARAIRLECRICQFVNA